MANEANSPQFTLNERDWKAWFKSAVVWFAPVALIYITAILGVLQLPNHEFSLKDFIPSTFTQGGIATWFLMRIQDIILKFVDDNQRK